MSESSTVEVEDSLFKPIEKRLASVQGWIVAITLAVTSIGVAVKELKVAAVPVLGLLDPLPVIARIAVYGALFIALATYIAWWRRRSVPDVPLERDRGSLVGRDKDLANLIDVCRNHSLVFLVGDSGVGKSTMIAEGLVPTLATDQTFAVVHHRHWGDDWIRGPARTFADTLWRELGARVGEARSTSSSDGEEEVGDVDKRPNEDTWEDFVRETERLLKVRLLVVFDGFDDYALASTEQLFVPERSQYLTSDELVDVNPFWAGVERLLRDGVMQCVFVTRSDAMAPLASVAFAKPRTVHLRRLQRAHAEKLLDGLLGNGNENAQWKALRTQLLNDLDRGGMLPAQIVSAERALRTLPRVTLREYQRHGGLRGLERRQIELHVRSAAVTARVSEKKARELLVSMCDTSTNPPKARIRSFDDLAAIVGNPEATEAVLSALEEQQIVRNATDDATGAASRTLYHDYVARNVGALSQYADQWSRRLSTAHDNYDQASGVVAKWSSLPSLMTQSKLMWQRVFGAGLRGNFRYRGHRLFAAFSLVRVAPYVALTMFASYWYCAVQTEKQAQALFTRVSFDVDTPRQSDIRALWDLKGARDRVQDSMVEFVLSHPAAAEKFLRGGEMITHAIVGFDRDRRADILRLIHRSCVDADEPDLRIAGACLRIGLTLEDEHHAFWVFAHETLWRKLEAEPDVRRYERNPGVNTFASWARWVITAEAPAVMPQSVSDAFYVGLEGALAKESVSRLDERVRIMTRFMLKPTPEQSASLVATLRESRHLGARYQVAVLWYLGAVQPELSAEPLLAALHALDYENPFTDYARTEVPGSAALFERLLARVTSSEAVVTDKLVDLVALLPLAPIEEDRRQALQAVVQSLPVQLADPEEEDWKADFPEFEWDEAAALARFKSRLAEVRPRLKELGRPEVADAVDDLGRRVMRMLAVDQRGVSKDVVVATFFEVTGADPMLCLSLVLNDPDFLEEDGWPSADEKETWLEACRLGAEVFESIFFDGLEHGRPLEYERAELIERVIDGRLELFDVSDEGESFSSRMEYGVGQPEQSKLQTVIELVIAGAQRDPDLQVEASIILEMLIDLLDDGARHDALNRLINIAIDPDSDAQWTLLVGDLVVATVPGSSPNLALPRLNRLAEKLAVAMASRVDGALNRSDELVSLCKLVASRRDEVASTLIESLRGTTDVEVLHSLRPALDVLYSDVDAENLVELLQWPTCVAACRRQLVNLMYQVTDGKSGSTFWTIEAWIRETEPALLDRVSMPAVQAGIGARP